MSASGFEKFFISGRALFEKGRLGKVVQFRFVLALVAVINFSPWKFDKKIILCECFVSIVNGVSL